MKKSFALAVALMLGAVVPASSATVFSEEFAYGANTVLNATDPLFGGNWNVTGGTVDYLAEGSGFGGLCLGFPGCVDLDGSTNMAGKFSTTMVFGPGIYNLRFQVAGSNRGTTETVTITLGGLSFDVTLGSGDVAFHGSFGTVFQNIVVGAGGSVLSFQNHGGDNVGIILKSVFVDQVAAVPVPAAGGMLVAGLGGLAALRRRKSRA